MSAMTSTGCPDWRRLAAERDDVTGKSPAGWAAALAHFDACPRCRPEALAADPLLVFRRLPMAGIAELTAAEEQAEAASVLQAVTAMRTAKRLESRRRFAGWRRWAAAAVLALVSLSVSRDKTPMEPLATMAEAPATAPAARIGGPVEPAASLEAEPADLPEVGSSFEDLNRRHGTRVYQYQMNKTLSVTMIVNKNLDV